MVHPVPNNTATNENHAKDSSTYVHRSAINKPSQYHHQQHHKNVKQPLTSSSIRQEYYDPHPIYHGLSNLINIVAFS